jgi:hypothetical protein
MVKQGRNWIISASGGVAIRPLEIVKTAESSDTPAVERVKAALPYQYQWSVVLELTHTQLGGGSLMSGSRSRSWFAWRTVVWILSCGAALLLVATLYAASQRGTETDRGGASPYTPSKGEWLCVLLNSRQALMNSERVPRGVNVHYVYDLSKPDVLGIRLLYVEGTGKDQVRICAARAESYATEAARVYGWQNWLKIEFEERTITYLSHSDALIR